VDESNELMSVRRIEVFVCETAPRSGAPLRLKRFLFALGKNAEERENHRV